MEKRNANSDFLAILRCPLDAMVTGNVRLSIPLQRYGAINICAKFD
jgi:hypothetical protein